MGAKEQKNIPCREPLLPHFSIWIAAFLTPRRDATRISFLVMYICIIILWGGYESKVLLLVPRRIFPRLFKTPQRRKKDKDEMRWWDEREMCQTRPGHPHTQYPQHPARGGGEGSERSPPHLLLFFLPPPTIKLRGTVPNGVKEDRSTRIGDDS